jgi:DNA-binding CsgD family transcriptional regulator
MFATEVRPIRIGGRTVAGGELYGKQVPNERESRVIALVAQGLKNSEVAEALGTTQGVVKNYIHDIYDKLGLWNRVELALWYEARRHEAPVSSHDPASAEPQGRPMASTEFFQCDSCHLEYRVYSKVTGPDRGTITIKHCSDSKGVTIIGIPTRFQERRSGVWVDVQRWIDMA